MTAFVREEIVLKQVEPILKSKLGEAVSVDKFSLDSGHPPTIDKIAAVPYRRPGMTDTGVKLEIPLELSLMHADNAGVEISYGPLKVGLVHLTLSGTLIVYVRPMLSRVPFIGGMEIAFGNRPRVELQFSGIG